jgi:hypothetical protein
MFSLVLPAWKTEAEEETPPYSLMAPIAGAKFSKGVLQIPCNTILVIRDRCASP